MPPNFSTIPFKRWLGMLSVPLKFMCSTQCEMPVRPGRSSPDPTRYQHQTETSGEDLTSLTRILRPLSRVVDLTSVMVERTPEDGICPLYEPVSGKLRSFSWRAA